MNGDTDEAMALCVGAKIKLLLLVLKHKYCNCSLCRDTNASIAHCVGAQICHYILCERINVTIALCVGTGYRLKVPQRRFLRVENECTSQHITFLASNLSVEYPDAGQAEYQSLWMEHPRYLNVQSGNSYLATIHISCIWPA